MAGDEHKQSSRSHKTKRKMDSKENSDRYWNKYPRRDTDEDPPPSAERTKSDDKPTSKPRERKNDLLTSRTGGAYIPPAKLRLMQAEITDKSSVAYQRIAWEALKKSIRGCINKVNTSNIGVISVELLHENIVRGRGLLCKSLMQAQTASPTFTNIYVALVAIINSKFPNIGELLLKRLVLQFKRGFKQNNKTTCISSAIFIAHLVNQRVAHEILALEILTLLVESPTDDSVEVAIAFLKECGQKLTEVSRKGINAIFEMLRNILHEGQLENRIQYMIEVMYQIRKDGFKDHAAVTQELDLIREEDQFTHLIMLDDVKQTNAEDILNVFKFDDNYQENEEKYKTLTKEILDSDDESDSDEESDSEEEEDDEKDEEAEEEDKSQIIDNTETNLTILRRTIYLTIQSSLDFEECAHKLMKMELKPGQEIEMCHMFLDCCAEQRTYEKFYGLLAQRFCQINKIYVEPFQTIFRNTFSTAHRLDTNRIRNVSKFFAHLLFTDAISWEVLDVIKLNEEDSNSSSRVFIKILFLELAEYMGLAKLNTRLKDPTLQEYFAGLFPRDNPKNTRFAINFFTFIGLGGLTDELREHLKTAPKIPQLNLDAPSSDSGGTSSSESSSTDSSSSDSEEESQKKKKQSSDSEGSKKKKKQKSKEDKDKKSTKKHKSKKENKKTVKDDSDHESSSKKNKSSRDHRDESKKRKDSSEDERKKHKKDRKNYSPSPRRTKDSSVEDERRYQRKSDKKDKDYDWMKSRHEDNIKELKKKIKVYESDRRRRSRSRSRDRHTKAEKRK